MVTSLLEKYFGHCSIYILKIWEFDCVTEMQKMFLCSKIRPLKQKLGLQITTHYANTLYAKDLNAAYQTATARN